MGNDTIDELDELRSIEASLATILAEEDVEHLAAAVEPAGQSGRSCGKTVGRARTAARTDATAADRRR